MSAGLVILFFVGLFGVGFSPFWFPLLTHGHDGFTRKEKRREAAKYAEWLELTYPFVSVKKAAEIRAGELVKGSYYLTPKAKSEARLCLWVSEGWHEWTGAVV